MGDRRIPLRNAFNFRDLGGVPARSGMYVRRGAAFRADGLHRLDDEDIRALEALGVGRVFDLRSHAELARDGIGEFAGRRARHYHVPLVKISLSPFDPEIDWERVNLRDRYIEMLEEGGVAIRTIMEALAERDAMPLVFHCSGGKDRTGVVAALIQRTLGVDDDVAIADYALSESYLGAAVRSVRWKLEGVGLGPHAIAYLTSSPPERMRYTLSELDRRWGSTSGYLRSIGVSEETAERLERNLLSGPGTV